MAYDPHLTPISPSDEPASAPIAIRPEREPDGVDLGDMAIELLPSPVNYRLLAVSIAGLVVLVGAIGALHGYQVSRIADSFRELGEQARGAGDPSAAVSHLRRYLAIAPDDIEAIEEMAFSIAEIAQTPAEKYRATELFERILRDSPDAVVVRRKLANLYTELARFRFTFHSDAVDHLNRLLLNDPLNAELLALRAANLEMSGRYAEARVDYEAAVEAAPRDLDTYGRLVRLLSDDLDQPREAVALLNGLVQRNPKNANAFLARSRFHWERGRVRESRIDAERAYRLDSENRDVLVFLVTLIAYSDWPSQPVTADELKSRLVRASRTDDEDRAVELALVDLAMLEGDYADAEGRLDSILETRPGWETAKWLLADVMNLTGQPEAAEELVKELRTDTGNESNLSRFLRARNAFNRRDWPAAALLFRRVFDSSKAPPSVRTPAGLGLAACYREMGQSLREQQACLDVLAANPDSSEAVFQLAGAHVRLDNLEEALQQFRRLSESPEAARAGALILIELNRRLPDAEQRWDRVDAAVEAAANLQPKPVEALLLRAQQAIARQRQEEASEILTGALKAYPGDERLWMQLFEAKLSRREWDAAAATLEQAAAAVQPSNAIRSARIRLAAARRDRAALSSLTESVAALSPENGEQRAVLHRDLAIAWQSLGDVAKACECWDAVQQHRPHDVGVLQALLALALFEADDSRAQQLVQEMQEVEGTIGVRWRMAEAERLIALAERGQRDSLKEADRILKRLDEQMPPSAALSTRRGDVARLQDDVEGALRHYLAAIESGKPSRNCVLQASQLMFQRGQFADVSRLIRRFEKSDWQTLDPRLAQLGAYASLQEKEFLEAVRFAGTSADPNSTSFQNQIWLGQFQQIAGQHEQAEASFRRATELAPEHPAGWIALVSFLAALGRQNEADAAMAEAQSAVSPDLADFMMAQCYEALDDLEQAATYYERTVSAWTDDARQLEAAVRFFMRSGRRGRAMEILRPIAAQDGPDSQPVLMTARRLLAVILADSDEYADHAEALGLLNRNLAAPEQSGIRQDRLLEARLLAVSRLNRDRRAARELFRKLKDDGSLPVGDVRRVAELHRKLGEPQIAIDVVNGLVARTHRNPEILAWAIDFVLSAAPPGSMPVSVGQWLETLETLRPDASAPRVLRARWMISRDRFQEALALLRSVSTQPPSDGTAGDRSNEPMRLALATDRIAQDLDRNGQLAAAEDFARLAEDLYRQAQAGPDASLLLVRFLMRRWRVEEAVKICEELRGTLEDERLAQTYVSLLRTRQVAPEQASEIRGWLDSRRKADPGSAILALCSAHAASLEGDYETALRLHRRVIELDPTHVEALNELAFLLALQGDPSQEAMGLIGRAIEHAGPIGMLLDTRATVELANQQPADAERSAQAAIAESPSADFSYHLAQAQLALGKRDQARVSLRTAFKRGLHVNTLHPLERPGYEKLQSELEP